MSIISWSRVSWSRQSVIGWAGVWQPWLSGRGWAGLAKCSWLSLLLSEQDICPWSWSVMFCQVWNLFMLLLISESSKHILKDSFTWLLSKTILFLNFQLKFSLSGDRSTEVLFPEDWSFILIFSTFNLIGGYLSNASLMLGPKTVINKRLIKDQKLFSHCWHLMMWPVTSCVEISGVGGDYHVVRSSCWSRCWITVWTYPCFSIMMIRI